jgi:hypothetical protein
MDHSIPQTKHTISDSNSSNSSETSGNSTAAASKELHYWGLAGVQGTNYILALVPRES